MEPLLIGYVGLGVLLVLLFFGVPIAFAMGTVGLVGIALVTGVVQALAQATLIAWEQGTNFTLICIPLFILMGALTETTGIATDLYDCVQKWFGRRRGGLAVASVFACGGFGAVTGSSVATVATMGGIVYPEMRARGYDPRLSTGVLAASGTLGILIPPSLAFAFIGSITDISIAKLFIAGILPGVLTIAIFWAIIWFWVTIHPSIAPKAPQIAWRDRWKALKGVGPVLVIFGAVIGVLYGGIATPTEASGLGACAVALVGLFMGRLKLSSCRTALVQTGIISGFIYAIIIGGFLMARFLVVTGLSDNIMQIIADLQPSRGMFIGFMVVLFLILGMMLDVFGMTILTVPFLYPVVLHFNIDPVWFGVFVVVMTEVALITPPVGVNVFVMKSIAPEISMSTIFAGVGPFLIGEAILIGLLIAYPQIALYLPSLMTLR